MAEENKAPAGKIRRNLHLAIGAAVGIGLIVAVLLGTGGHEEGRKDSEQPPPTPPPAQPIAEVIQAQKKKAEAAPPPTPPEELIAQLRQESGAAPTRRQEDIERARREAEALASPISLNIGAQEARAAPATPSAVESILLKQVEVAAQAARARESETAAAIRAAAESAVPPSPAQANAQWLEAEARRNPGDEPIRARRPAWRFTVQAGSVIPATLLSRVNSDLPGLVTAQVASDVYDSLTSSVLLIPKGSRLVGRYNSEVRPGQARVLIAFGRIYFPDGRYADLEAMQGADAIGQAGLADRVDNHFLRMFGASFLIAGISRLFGDRADITINNFGGGSTVTSDVLGTALSEAARAALERHRNIPPTIVIEEGFRFNVMVSRDLALEPYAGR